MAGNQPRLVRNRSHRMTSASWLNLPSTIDGPGDLQLRQVTADMATGLQKYYDEQLSRSEYEELFHFFTRSPLPLEPFISDAMRTTYALYRGDRPVAQTSVYDADKSAQTVTLGFTFVLPRERGAGHNAVLKSLLFRELAARGVREVWFRMDETNTPSRRGVERAGAVFSHVEDAPRKYPDGRVGRSVFFRRELRKPDWVFAASNGFAVRVQNLDELESLTLVALGSGEQQGVEWIQIQHAQAREVFVAFDRVPQGWQASADAQHQNLVEDVRGEDLDAEHAARLLGRFI